MTEVPVPEPPSGPLLVIGLGNDHRRDDRCGLEVVRRLRGRLPGSVRLVEGPHDATGLLDLWDGAGRVIVIDAMQGNGRPGSVRRIEVEPGDGLAGSPSTSTHGLGLAEAVAIGRSLGRLPRRLTVFGIEVAELGMGDGLGPDVMRGVEAVTEEVAREVGGLVPPVAGG